MSISRYEIRNEYSLTDPELYRAADKDDREALLEGVAMAGLVGILRQLGDLADVGDLFDSDLDASQFYFLSKVLPGLIGGSADLASSNKVYLHDYEDFQQPNSPWGRNIRYGVREHAMAGISNGIALHGGGLIPFAATFLIFFDYMKNSIRLSAISNVGVLYIMTHDSIGLGEDGPTHQPVEQLAGLRVVPCLLVFRPANGNETAGAYKVAVTHWNGPSLVALSRQKVVAHIEGTSEDVVEMGGYIISDNSGEDLLEIILIGTGSELCLCEASAGVMRKEGKRVRVVSLVCWRLFDRQPNEYKEEVLPSRVVKRVSVEAGSPIGWREYVGPEGFVLGVEDFGASGYI